MVWYYCTQGRILLPQGQPVLAFAARVHEPHLGRISILLVGGVMTGLKRTVLGLMAACVSWADPPPTIADYNAADVRNASGVLTVPAMIGVYTATSTIPIGASFIVTLASGFTF